MEAIARSLTKQIRRLYPKQTIRRVILTKDEAEKFRKYRNDPLGFFRDILGVTLTEDQQRIALAFIHNAQNRNRRIKVNSGHGIGKSFIAACITLWWLYSRNPSVVITTAPKQSQVEGILWTEIRIMHAKARVRLPDWFIGPQAPKMYDNPEHWAIGQTAQKGENFQGRHRASMLFVFEEAEGLDSIYWETTDTMFKPEPEWDHAWFAIGNPTTTSSQSYQEDMAVDHDDNPKWRTFNMSALDHPNIKAQLAGKPAPIANAVSLGQVYGWLKQWCTRIPSRLDTKKGDIEFPPQSGQWWRPGPLFMGRVLGLRPITGIDTVWGTDSWEEAVRPKADPRDCWLAQYGITIGVDVATYGDDDTVFHVRCGPLSLHHESRNGWLEDKTADRIKELCEQWSYWYNQQSLIADRPPLVAQRVQVIIERDGPGSGVLSHNKGWGDWRGLVVAERANKPTEYPDKRSEMWFNGRDLARQGAIDLSRVNTFDNNRDMPTNKEVLSKLKHQLLTPSYVVEIGRSRVESKKDVKERIKRSPDDADGFLVSHYAPPSRKMENVGTGTAA